MTELTDEPTGQSLETPETVEFDGLSLPVSAVLRAKGNSKGPVPSSWQRVAFPIPDGYTSARAVEEWLGQHCPNRWASYHYNNPKQKITGDRIMVVRFEDKNDALLFKLRGGHQAWEQKSNS